MLGADEPSRAALEQVWRDTTAGSNLRVSALTALVAISPTNRRAEILRQAAADPDPAITRCARALGGD
jgi:hypothetical protein